MKTDTDDVVRVSVTFNRASQPEWFELLHGIESGRARADLVKSHLQLPDAKRFSKRNKSVIGAEKKEPLQERPQPKKTSGEEVSDSPSVLNSSTKNLSETAQTGVVEKPNEFSKESAVLNSHQSVPPGGGGLSGLLMGSGVRGVGRGAGNP